MDLSYECRDLSGSTSYSSFEHGTDACSSNLVKSRTQQAISFAYVQNVRYLYESPTVDVLNSFWMMTGIANRCGEASKSASHHDELNQDVARLHTNWSLRLLIVTGVRPPVLGCECSLQYPIDVLPTPEATCAGEMRGAKSKVML